MQVALLISRGKLNTLKLGPRCRIGFVAIGSVLLVLDMLLVV